MEMCMVCERYWPDGGICNRCQSSNDPDMQQEVADALGHLQERDEQQELYEHHLPIRFEFSPAYWQD